MANTGLHPFADDLSANTPFNQLHIGQAVQGVELRQHGAEALLPVRDRMVLMAFGDLLIGWKLLQHADIAAQRLLAGTEGDDRAFHEGKIATAVFFAKTVLPELSAARAIIEDTDISSGALMHHFPTRQKLLIATVEYAYASLVEYRRRQIEHLDPGLPRFRALIDMSWHSSRMPAGFAINEVRIGVRSDDDLAATFRPVFASIAQDYGRFASQLVHESGLEPNQELQGLWTVTSMAMRSMAIDRKTYADNSLAVDALLALRTLRESLVRKLRFPSSLRWR